MKKIKDELIRYGKLVYSKELVIGTGGNISARSGGKIYIKASGVSLEDSKANDYNEVDLKTSKAICHDRPCSIEIPMHLACYAVRHDIGAVIHIHPIYGTIVGMLVKNLGFISYEMMCTVSTEVPVIGYKKSGSRQLAMAVGGAIKKHNAVLLKNHGAVVVGSSIKEAYFRALALERACKTYILSRIAGQASFLPTSELKRLSCY